MKEKNIQAEKKKLLSAGENKRLHFYFSQSVSQSTLVRVRLQSGFLLSWVIAAGTVDHEQKSEYETDPGGR